MVHNMRQFGRIDVHCRAAAIWCRSSLWSCLQSSHPVCIPTKLTSCRSAGKEALHSGHSGDRCARYVKQCTQPLCPHGSVVGPPNVPSTSVHRGHDGRLLPLRSG